MVSALPSYLCRHRRHPHARFSMRRLCEAARPGSSGQGAGWAEGGCLGALLCPPQPVLLQLPSSSTSCCWAQGQAALKLPSNNRCKGSEDL